MSAEPAFGVEERTPWTTSRLKGSPEPPPPYQTRQIFSNLHFKEPVAIVPAPSLRRYFVCEHEGKIFSFVDQPDVPGAELAVDLRKQVQTVQLCPGAAKVTETLWHGPASAVCRKPLVLRLLQDGSGLLGPNRRWRAYLALTVTQSDPPKLDPASEQIVISWLGGGRNGGCLQFGPKATCTSPAVTAAFRTPPDPRHTGQDIGDLLSSVLRIDVDHEQLADSGASRPYTIPADNPFVDRPGDPG